MPLINVLNPRNQLTNGRGEPLRGATIWLYEPGTTIATPIPAFKDAGLVRSHSQPIRASASGRANIWINQNCDIRIEDRHGSLVSTEENINPDSLGFAESGGLIANGSFEIDADADTIPDSWTLVNETGSTNAIDTGQSTDGAQSFRFTSAGTGGGSLTTVNFFPVNDVDSLRVNVDLRSTVAGVRNIVRVEWYDVSMVSISNTDAYDSTANPLTFTTQNLVVPPPVGARFAKLRLIGIDPTVALAGSTFFDRVSVFYPAVVGGVFGNITIQGNEIISTNANGAIELDPNGTGVIDLQGPVAIEGALTLAPATVTDLVDNDNALNVGAVNPAVSAHLALDPSTIQAKADATTAALLSLNPLGGDVRLSSGGMPRLRTAPSGVARLLSDGTSDTEVRRLDLTYSTGVRRAYLGHNGAELLSVANDIPGGMTGLYARNAADEFRQLFVGNPDGGSTINYGASNMGRLSTTSTGIGVNGDTNGDAENRRIDLRWSDNTLRAVLGFLGDGELRIENRVHGGTLSLRTEDAGGLGRRGIEVFPDASLLIYNPEANVVRAAADADGFAVRSDDNTNGTPSVVQFQRQNEAVRGLVGHVAGDLMVLSSAIGGGLLQISGTNTGAVARTFVAADPDAGIDLYHPASNAIIAASTTPALGGLTVNNTLTGAGSERVLTESDNARTSVMTSASTRSSTTSVSRIADLDIPLTVGRWLVDFFWLYSAASTLPTGQGPRHQLQFSGGTATISWAGSMYDGAPGSAQSVGRFFDSAGGAERLPACPGTTARALQGKAIVNVTVAGTLEFHWAQIVSDANVITINAGSSMKAIKLT